MSTASPVRLKIADSIAIIILDQPGSRANVLSTGMWLAIENAVAEVASRNDVDGLIILSAKDGIFLAGADLKELAALPMDDEGPARTVVRNGLRVLAALEALTIPTAAAIDGACLGGGYEVALACDYRLCGTHPKVKLGLPETKLNLIPGWGGTQRLPRVIGAKQAAELLATGRSVDGQEALTLGMADRVIDSSGLLKEAIEILSAAPNDDWELRRARKQSPCDTTLDSFVLPPITNAVSEDEYSVRLKVVSIVQAGLKLPLAPAIECETNEFVRLLMHEQSRKRIAAFLGK